MEPVENFKLVVFVDGLDENPIELETVGVGAGFSVGVFQRDGDYLSRAFEIEGHVTDDGVLVVEVRNRAGSVVARSRTR
ncbi:MAG: hypothetical protein EPO21_08610 [Chloroflexota bacterium]|nr:MAG: hypothetical protein EPO21_08610 [Chloroflexota bacterium]